MQCTLNGTGSSVVANGNSVTVNVASTFKAAGTKAIYMSAQDLAGGNSNWQSRGAWTVPGTANWAPSPVSAMPSSETVFRFVSSDANGYADVQNNQIVFNSSLSAVNGCYMYYYRPANAVYLMNDSGTAWSGPVTLGISASAANSRCTAPGPRLMNPETHLR